MRLSIYRTLTEALGFGALQFEKTARMAWLPMALLTLLGVIAPYIYLTVITGHSISITDVAPNKAVALLQKNMAQLFADKPITMLSLSFSMAAVQILLITSFFVPLLRYAARGVALPGTSFPLVFSFKHLRFLLALLLAGGGLYLFIVLPMNMLTDYVSNSISDALEKTVFVFPYEDSLHTVEEKPLLENAGWLSAIPGYIVWPFLIALLYFSLRLFPYPTFVAAHEKADNHNAFVEACRTTSGLNTLRIAFGLFVLFVILFGLQPFGLPVPGVFGILTQYVLPTILGVINQGFVFVGSTTRIFSEDGAVASWVLPIFVWLWTIFSVGFSFAFTFLMYGMIIGFSASIYRQRAEAIGAA